MTHITDVSALGSQVLGFGIPLADGATDKWLPSARDPVAATGLAPASATTAAASRTPFTTAESYADPVTNLSHGCARLRAAELARASDAQAQSAAFCVRAAVALDAARHAEAGELASELAAIGRVLLPALNAPFPTFVEVAWLFRDLGRKDEFSALLDATPIESPWMDAAQAIISGNLVRAAEIIDEMGHAAAAAYARLRAAEALAAEGRQREAAAQLAQALSFYRKVGATAYVRRGEELVSASAQMRRSSANR